MGDSTLFVIDRYLSDYQTLIARDIESEALIRRFDRQDVTGEFVHAVSADVANRSNLTVSGRMLAINLAADLLYGSHYFVTLASGSITDFAGNGYGGTPACDFTTELPLVADTTAPTVSSYTPSDAATGVAVGSNIVLIFSEAIQKGIGTIVIHSGSATGTTVAAFDAATSGNLSVSGSTLTINPSTDLTTGTVYFVSLAPGSIKDLAGNSCMAQTDSYHFKTHGTFVMVAGSLESWGYLASYPDLMNAFGADVAAAASHYNNTGAAEHRSISFDGWDYLASNNDLMNAFGTDVQKAAEHYILTGRNESRSLAFDAASYLSVNPDLALCFGTDYDGATQHYIVTGRFEMAQGLRPSFSTVFLTPPAITGYAPVDAASGVAVGSDIILTFSEAIKRGSGSIVIHSGSLTGSFVETYDAATSENLLVSGSTLIINPSADLAAGTVYFVSLPTGSMKDLAGNSCAAQAGGYHFKTGGTFVMIAGSLESWEYLASYPDLMNAFGTDVAVAASHYNNTGMVEHRSISFDGWDYLASNNDLINAFGTDVQKATAHYILTGRNENRSFAFDAASYLSENTDLALWFGTDYDAAAQHYIGTGRFEMAQGLRPSFSQVFLTPPEVIGYTPADDASGVAVGSDIVLTFSKAIQKGSGTIVIHIGSATGIPIATYDVTTSDNLVVSGKILTINPAADLGNGTHYFVTLDAGSIKDLAGNSYEGTLTYDFTTADTIAPTVFSYSPFDDSTGVAIESDIILTFSEAIQKGSGTIVIHSGSATGTPIVTYDVATSGNLEVSGNTLTINPTADLANSAHYFVTLDAGSIKDLAGNSFEGTTTYDFTTEADTTPPWIVGFTPHDAAVNVSVSSNIVLTFSETIHRGSGTIELHRDSPTGSVVESYNVATSGNISLSGNILTINPDADLANGTHYYLTISEGSVKDLAGNSYSGTSSYDFTTVFSVSSAFNISLDYSGDEAYRTYFQQAVTRWEEIITGDLPAYGGIDDISISASVSGIDGTGGTLAQAAPEKFRATSNHLPYEGFMEFDVADVPRMANDGILTSVIIHEIAHVLGFGSNYLWDAGKFYAPLSGQYTGANALNEYRSLSGNGSATYVPVETGGGSGTANAHWRETVFGRELMTGWSSSSLPMPLSRLTIGAMEDLGYTVNYSAADVFSLSSAFKVEMAGFVDTSDGTISALFLV